MKKLYYVIECGSDSEYEIARCEEKVDAIKEARGYFDHLSDYDKKSAVVQVRDYDDDIENEDCDNFDYDLIDWGLVNREEVIDKIAEILADHEFSAPNYQVDIYLYVDNAGKGEVDTFVNVGGNSWLDDDHYTVDSMTQYNGGYEPIRDYYRDGGVEALAWAVDVEEATLVDEAGSSDYSEVYDYILGNENYKDKLKDDYLSDSCFEVFSEEAESIIEQWEERLIEDAR